MARGEAHERREPVAPVAGQGRSQRSLACTRFPSHQSSTAASVCVAALRLRPRAARVTRLTTTRARSVVRVRAHWRPQRGIEAQLTALARIPSSASLAASTPAPSIVSTTQSRTQRSSSSAASRARSPRPRPRRSQATSPTRPRQLHGMSAAAPPAHAAMVHARICACPRSSNDPWQSLAPPPFVGLLKGSNRERSSRAGTTSLLNPQRLYARDSEFHLKAQRVESGAPAADVGVRVAHE